MPNWVVQNLLAITIVWQVKQPIQSTLSKADTLGTKATVHFGEVSGLESVD